MVSNRGIHRNLQSSHYDLAGSSYQCPAAVARVPAERCLLARGAKRYRRVELLVRQIAAERDAKIFAVLGHGNGSVDVVYFNGDDVVGGKSAAVFLVLLVDGRVEPTAGHVSPSIYGEIVLIVGLKYPYL